MNLKDYLSITPEIQEALAAGKPVVALESTILSHGMPYPQNVEFAHKVEEIVRAEGAIPATTAIMGGKLKVGLNADELLVMCKAEGVGKVSRRDVAVYLATGMTGATTVATTMIIASMAGIRFFATGGIGGVHRGAEKTMDISADLQELANTPVCVVCAGPERERPASPEIRASDRGPECSSRPRRRRARMSCRPSTAAPPASSWTTTARMKRPLPRS